MSTNYYVKVLPNFIDTLKGVEPKLIHIGKQSAGWVFSLRGYADIDTLDKWIKFVRKHRKNIYDEYGRKIEMEEMIKMVISPKPFNGNDPKKFFGGSSREIHGRTWTMYFGDFF